MNLGQPIFSELHRSSMWTRTLRTIGWILIPLALFTGGKNSDAWWPDSLILLALGFVLVGFVYFITPRYYNIYKETLVIAYGGSLKRTISFHDISQLRIISHPLGTEIKLRRTRGWPLSIQPWQPKQFHAKLEAALNQFVALRGQDEFGLPIDGPTSS